MAELKPIKITVDGVDKAVKSVQQLERELQDVRKELEAIKNSGNDAGKSLSNIDKGVKFANFRMAVNQAKNALAETVAASITGGKTMSETVSNVGQSIAGVASAFGLWGVAIGAGISLLTPLVASLFEASAAQKELAADMEDTRKVSESLGKEIGSEISTLLSLTAVVNDSSASYNEKEAALSQLNKEYAPYLEQLGIAKINTQNITDATLLLTTAIIQNAIATAARKNLEESLSTVIAAQTQRIILKNKAEENASKVAAAKLRLDKELIKAGVNERTGTQNRTAAVIAAEKALREASEAQAQYNAGQFASTVVSEAATDGAKDQAEAYRELSTSLDLSDVIKQFTELFGITQQISSPKSVKAVKSATKDYVQFGDAFEDIVTQTSDLIENQEGTFSDIERGIAKADAAASAYLATIKGLSPAAKDAADANAKLNAEATANFDRIAKLNLETQNRTRKFLQELAANPQSTTIFSGSETTRQKLLKLAQDLSDGAIDINFAIANLTSENGQVLGVSSGVIKKNLEEVAKIQKENDRIAKEIKKNQQVINSGSGDDAVKERLRVQKILSDLRKKASDQEEAFRKKALQEEKSSADAAYKAALEAGEATLDKRLADIERRKQAEIDAELAKTKTAIDAANRTVKGIVTDTGGFLEVDLNLFEQYMTVNPNDANGLLTAVENTNSSLANVSKKFRTEEQNANLDFIRDYLPRFREMNRTEIEEFEAGIKFRTLIVTAEERKIFDIIAEGVAKRRKAREVQTEEELAIIQQGLSDELLLNGEKFDLLLAQETEFQQRAIDQLKAKGADTAIEELKLSTIVKDIQIKREEAELAIIKKYKGLKDEERQNTNQEIIREGVEITKQLQTFGNLLVDLFNQNSQNIIDGLNEQLDSVEDRTADALSRIASLEDDLEGKRSGRREAVLQALEQQREIEAQLAQEKIALAKRIEDEERKIRKREQAAAIANALINGAIAQTNIWATVPKEDFGVSTFVLSGIAAGITAAQVALIASQKFAKGGFTGDGSFKDETGHKVAGVVHDNEWVAPKWMVESPKFGGVINQLENARRKGFAQGGFTSPDYNGLSNAVNPNNTANMERIMQRYMSATMELANRPIYTKATEVATVAQRNNNRRAATTI